jgi:hypothetical protein
MNWQPMSTAPKDGTPFLAWWPYWCMRRPVVAQYDGATGAWDSDACLSPVHTETYPERQPTHWMPLPEPPLATQGDGGGAE